MQRALWPCHAALSIADVVYCSNVSACKTLLKRHSPKTHLQHHSQDWGAECKRHRLSSSVGDCRLHEGRANKASAATAPAATLEKWVLSSGGVVSGVGVQQWNGEDGGSGFGLKATQNTRAGAQLLLLPQSCHLTYDKSSDPRLLALIQQVPDELWGAKLALQVLAQRVQGDSSSFAPYVAALPQGVPGLPMFFSGEALAALQYPPVTEQVKRRCRWLLSFSQSVLEPLRGGAQDPFGGATVDANALGWALGVVTSRAFRTRGPSQPAAMLPFIDMANHSFQPNAKISPGPGGAICMSALTDLQAGEPVVISYGSLKNDYMLMDYGFLSAENPFETVELRFDPALIEAGKAAAGLTADADVGEEAAPLAPWQQQALASLQLAGEGATLQVDIRRPAPPGSSGAADAGSPVDARLLGAVRVLCAKSAAELGSRRGPEQLGSWAQPLSAANEAAALVTLTGVCAIALSQFSGTLEDDAALLAQQPCPLAEDVQLAVRFRKDKKALLLEALATLSHRVKQLKGQGDRGAGAAAAGGRGSSSSGATPAAKPSGKVAATKNGGRGFGKQ